MSDSLKTEIERLDRQCDDYQQQLLADSDQKANENERYDCLCNARMLLRMALLLLSGELTLYPGEPGPAERLARAREILDGLPSPKPLTEEAKAG